MHTTKQDALYGGADLHGSNVCISLCDCDGRTVYGRRIGTDIDLVLKALDPYKDRLERIGVESTFNWYWFVDGLSDAGYTVDLGNPAAMQQYSGIKQTNDMSDAAWLAEQERLGIFPRCYIYPRHTRAVRDTLRRRQMFAGRRTQALLSLGGLLARNGHQAQSAEMLRVWTDESIARRGLEGYTAIQAAALLEAFRSSDRIVSQLEESVMEFAKNMEGYQRIQLVPGIGRILALTIYLESGDFARFKSAGNYASYCRGVQSKRTSNSKKKGENNRKNGNKYLSWAYGEAAVYATRYYPRIQSWYDRKRRRTNAPIARKALACKLSKAVWHVMNGRDYDESMMF